MYLKVGKIEGFKGKNRVNTSNVEDYLKGIYNKNKEALTSQGVTEREFVLDMKQMIEPNSKGEYNKRNITKEMRHLEQTRDYNPFAGKTLDKLTKEERERYIVEMSKRKRKQDAKGRFTSDAPSEEKKEFDWNSAVAIGYGSDSHGNYIIYEDKYGNREIEYFSYH